MFSPKLQHEKYKENLTFFKMYGNKDKTDYLGIIRFSDMIPVPKSEISILSSENIEKQYSMLLYKQYNYINKVENRDIIRKKAKDIHGIVVNEGKNKKVTFYKNLCCNFKILEERLYTYKK